MTKKTQRWHRLARLPLAATLALSVSAPVGAFQLNFGEIEASFDTTLGAGISIRTASRDNRQIAPGNLGVPTVFGGVPESAGGVRFGDFASTSNADDGNLNFDPGETYSKIVKGSSELFVKYRNFGGFVRGRYFYDFEIKDELRPFDDVGQRRTLNEAAQDDAGSRAEILDAYIFTDFFVGEVPVSLRWGQQVLSWGESTFIQGGINIINPVDAAAFRQPGAEIKDGLLPLNMITTSIGLTENLTFEGFYQFEWDSTRIDPCGTFFSTVDFVAEDCGPVLLGGQVTETEALAAGAVISRLNDDEADNQDQFGIALRYFSEALNNTEFGFYHIQYHSRLPVFSGNAAQVVENPDGSFDVDSSSAQFQVIFPENIKLYGVSFSTSTESGWSIAGEYSFRENLPVQRNPFDLIAGALLANNSLVLQEVATEQGIDFNNPAELATLGGAFVDGFEELHQSQFQVTAIKFFDQVAGANRVTFIGEAGATIVHDLPDQDEGLFGRATNFGLSAVNPTTTDAFGRSGFVNNPDNPAELSCSTGLLANLNQNFCDDEGFTDQFSWGYRAIIRAEYNNAIAGVNLVPQLIWLHDVQGFSPVPSGQFIEDRKAIVLGVTANYLNSYSATVSYTNFFDGGRDNLLNDRDNLQFSISYSF